MPCQTKYVESGIFELTFADPISLAEIADAVEQMDQLANDYGIEKYVTVNDFASCKNIPSDISNMKRIADGAGRLKGAVVVKAPLITQIMGRMVGRR